MTTLRQKIAIAAETNGFVPAPVPGMSTTGNDNADKFVHTDGREIVISYRMTKGAFDRQVWSARGTDLNVDSSRETGVNKKVLAWFS